MIDLDDLDALAALDSEDVLGAVERFPEQIREGWEIGLASSGLPDGTGVDSVVVLGMGGSGVAGDVAQAVLEPRLTIPLRVIKSYGPLPEWVGRDSLVFAVSYSGATEETLAALDLAHRRGVRAVAISSGGPLRDSAVAHGTAHVAIPQGLQPRASLGYLAMPILAVLQKTGIAPDLQADVDEAIKVLSDLAARCQRERSVTENPAKDLARRLHGKIPVIYGGYGIGGTAAMRFKCDLNEYGKVPAFWNMFPELDHNEIVGWNRLADVTAANFVCVLLRDPAEEDRVAMRFDITRGLTEQYFAEVIDITSEGRSELARLLSFVFVTQLAAIYVGLTYGLDPGPVEVIQRLKAELAKR